MNNLIGQEYTLIHHIFELKYVADSRCLIY
jgi:hypothetical protein